MTTPAATAALARALYEANCFDPNSIYHEFKMAEVERFAKDILRVPLTPAERAALAAALLTREVLAEALHSLAGRKALIGAIEPHDSTGHNEEAAAILAALAARGADRG